MVGGPRRRLFGWKVLRVVGPSALLPLVPFPTLPLLPRIDLGSLQAVGIVYVDCFPRGVKIERAGSAFAMPVAGLLHPAEGQMNLSPNGRRVDISDTGFQVTHCLQGQVYVAGIER